MTDERSFIEAGVESLLDISESDAERGEALVNEFVDVLNRSGLNIGQQSAALAYLLGQFCIDTSSEDISATDNLKVIATVAYRYIMNPPSGGEA